MSENQGPDLQERMANIRAKRIHRVAELQNEAERLTDWREHVKSAPMVALAGSALLGFLTMNAVKQPASKPSKAFDSSVRQAGATDVFPPNYFKSSVIRIVSRIALTLGKNFLAQQIQNISNKVNHDKLSNSSTH
jgi:hypothetical protein